MFWAAVVAVAPARWPTPRLRLSPATQTTWSSIAASPGTVRPLRPRFAGAHHLRRRRLHHSLWADVACPVIRHARPPLHARPLHRPRPAEGHRRGLLPPRPVQPPGGDARPAALVRGLRQLPLDRRTVPAVRLLHGERRRSRSHPDHRGACPRPEAEARVPPRRLPGSDYRQAAPSHNAPDYGTSNFKTVAKRLYAMAEVGPKDVDVCQSYENFTGGDEPRWSMASASPAKSRSS